MRFGVHLAGGSPSASMDRMARLAKRAEELGFHSLWLSDHVVTPARFKSPYPYANAAPFTSEGARLYYEPIVTLAWLAGLTRRVRLGISVLVVPQRNPLLTAKQLATLDDLSSGRLIVGVGAGWLEEEFQALHADFAGRGRTTDAYLRMFRRLWSGKPTRSTESSYRHRAVYSQPVPAQGARIPVWVGGHSERALRRTIEYGDGWHATRLDADAFRIAARRLTKLAAERNRRMPVLSTLCELDPTASEGPEDWRLAGSADTIASKLRRYAQAGCSEVVLGLLPRDSTEGMLETMDTFALRVRPIVDAADAH
jgi:probable F420-dependent oxidoreductase